MVKACLKHEPDFIIVEYIKLGYLVEGIKTIMQTKVNLIIDTHDINYIRTKRFHEAGEINYINITREEEIKALSKYDLICAIQKNEAAFLKGLLADKHCITVAHACEVTRQIRKPKDIITISFVGGGGPHNKNGIIYFINNIWKSIYPEYAGKIELKIYGIICNKIKNYGKVKGVQLQYYIKELSGIYADADIMINPAYIGTGLKIKSVEALCYAKPLVTTSLGVDGFEHGKNKAFYVCDTKEKFIQQLKELIGDKEKREALSSAAYEFAKKNFSADIVYRDLYNYLMQT
jgi:glycosyltransferase involved in cell wall biosynthesis